MQAGVIVEITRQIRIYINRGRKVDGRARHMDQTYESDVGLMLGRRLRRRPNISPTSDPYVWRNP